MKKKFLALVLTLAMVLSLVPVTALATDGTPTPDNATQPRTSVTADTEDGVHISKKVVQDGDNYNLVMEAYVEGTTEITTSTEPLDIVLVLDVSGSMDDPMGYSDRTKRIVALKSAVNAFIDEVAKKNTDDIGHRISIVKFAGDQKDDVGDDTYREDGYTYNYSQIVKNLTTVDADGKEALTDAVNSLNPAGTTRADYGMQLAQSVLFSNEDSNRDKVVVMFTDGTPTSGRYFESSVASGAISASKTLKDKGVKVYTVGIFDGADSREIKGDWNKWGLEGENKNNKYMQAVSSNYPTASLTVTDWSHSWNPGKRAEGKYYLTATDSEGLNNVFQEISDSITHTTVMANANAVLRDTLTKQFVFNGTGESAITVKKAEVNRKDGNTYTWKTPVDVTEITKDISEDGKTVTVKGFNYTSEDNVITEKNGAYSGYKLIVTIPIKVDDTYTGWLAGKHYYNTNDVESNKAGLTGYTKNGEEASTLLDTSPQVPVTAYTVTYKYDKEYPGAPDLDNDTKAYLPETSIKIQDAPTWTGYTFSGWRLPSDLEEQGGSFSMPAKNVELTGSWTAKNDVGYTVHYYKQGTTDKVAADKLVTGETFNTEVTETAKEVSGYTVAGDSTQKITLNAYDKEIIFYYTANTYTVTWMNGDTQLEKDEDVAWGTKPQYNKNETPTKAADSEYTYEFAGWSTTDGAETGTAAANLPEVTENVTYYAAFTKTAKTYTVIFDANGGAWKADGIPEYTIDGQNAVKNNLTVSDRISNVSGYLTETDKFLGWAATSTATQEDAIVAFSVMSPTVAQLKQWTNTDGHTITLYAIWKDVPQSAYTYTIRQHFMKDEKQELGAQNYIKLKEVQAGTEISTLIPSDTRVEFDGRTYLYEANNTTVNNQKYEGTEEITGKDTVIDLYYYLDSWKDGDVGPGDKTDDSLTGGDGTPDYKQILIQYQVYQKDNGLVTPEFEVVTVKNGNELTAIHGSSVTKAGTGYTFVTWTGQNATVNETTVDKIVAESTKLNNEDCNPSGDTFEQGKSYTYTAIFLEDKLGGGDNKDQPDGIPDAWQYKVTFKVVNGKWNNQTTADVVAYVTNKKNDTPCAKGTEGSKATLNGVTIPGAGSQPDSGYKASGSWKKTTPSTDLEIKEDTVFTYTYDQKSGGSGGSGGSHKPTVTIPDDVPTGLNGKDHYAYVVGYPDGMVYPQKNITRAEVATIFFRLLTDETREANMTKSNGYNDMKDGAWYTCAVSTLSKMGIIKGYEDGSFKPDASISRAEFAAIAARFDPDGDKTPATFSDVSSRWAKDAISIAANHGWIKGCEDGSFKPDQKITRAETMTLVNRVLKRLPETKDDLHKDMKTWPDNQNESAWFYLAVQEATNSHYQKLKKDGTHETWESMRETRDWAALEK